MIPPRASSLPGTVYLVGSGPGDPELMTLKAARLVREANVIVYDHLGAENVLDLARPDAEKIYAGKEASNHALPQEEINVLLVRLAKEGKRVVRLKGATLSFSVVAARKSRRWPSTGCPSRSCPV